MNLLLVEDESAKQEDLSEFFTSRFPGCSILSAKSVRGAVDALRSAHSIDLVVLDMSLPTFDVTDSEPGGTPKGFGGVDVLRYMLKCANTLPVIVVTAFEAFSIGDQIIDLDKLRENLLEEFPGNYKGAVYYDVVYTSWIYELQDLLSSMGIYK